MSFNCDYAWGVKHTGLITNGGRLGGHGEEIRGRVENGEREGRMRRRRKGEGGWKW